MLCCEGDGAAIVRCCAFSCRQRGCVLARPVRRWLARAAPPSPTDSTTACTGWKAPWVDWWVHAGCMTSAVSQIYRSIAISSHSGPLIDNVSTACCCGDAKYAQGTYHTSELPFLFERYSPGRILLPNDRKARSAAPRRHLTTTGLLLLQTPCSSQRNRGISSRQRPCPDHRCFLSRDDATQQVQRVMVGYWSRFANADTPSGADGLPSWPRCAFFAEASPPSSLPAWPPHHSCALCARLWCHILSVIAAAAGLRWAEGRAEAARATHRHRRQKEGSGETTCGTW